MAENRIPTNSGQLIGLGNKMLMGLNSLGESLGITQITPAAFQAKLTAYINGENTFAAARSAQAITYDSFHAADDALTAWLGVAKSVFTARFGVRWNTQWAQVGFITPSTMIPTRVEDRIALAGRIVAFLTANPSFAVPSLEVTAVRGADVQSVTISAQEDILTRALALSDADAVRSTAYTELVAAMRALISILNATLSKDDPRWQAFGLNIPASDTTPGQPQNVSASLDASGAVQVQCDAVPLATRYRWRTRLAGSGTAYALAKGTAAPLALLDEVAPGSSIEIIVQAVNAGTQGVASEPIVYARPAGAAMAALPKRTAVSEEAPEKHGNGSSGNGNGAHVMTAGR